MIGNLHSVVYETASSLNETWAELQKFMLLLSVEERVAIVLSYAHGFSHREISDITGMPIGTVKTHIRRGKSRISEKLLEGDG